MADDQTRVSTVRAALEAAVSGDTGTLEKLYSEGATGWAPQMGVADKAELVEAVALRAGLMSEIDLAFDHADVVGDKVIVEWRLTATHSGPLHLDEDVTVEPTGVRFTIHGATFAEFDGDRINAFRQYWDEAELFDQLGLVEVDIET